MRLAVISDIHANLPALEAVLRSVAGEGVDRTICLGDLVGYGGRPNECVDLIIDHEIPCIMGNHDEAAVGILEAFHFNPYAMQAILWTAKMLSDRSSSFLGNLPRTLELEGLLFVHSTPNEPEAWHYLFTAYEARLVFQAFRHPVCFFGHTHYPALFASDDGARRLVNVGSVGQPRDRDPRACWGLYDIENGSFRWVRVEYPVEAAARQIRNAGLPGFLADRLFRGV